MPTITFAQRHGHDVRVFAQMGPCIMEAATGNLAPGRLGDCGGCVSCGTCEARIEHPWSDRLVPHLDDEIVQLGDTQAENSGTRPTCRIEVTNELNGIVAWLA